jgi:hypothetical protein
VSFENKKGSHLKDRHKLGIIYEEKLVMPQEYRAVKFDSMHNLRQKIS